MFTTRITDLSSAPPHQHQITISTTSVLASTQLDFVVNWQHYGVSKGQQRKDFVFSAAATSRLTASLDSSFTLISFFQLTTAVWMRSL